MDTTVVLTAPRFALRDSLSAALAEAAAAGQAGLRVVLENVDDAEDDVMVAAGFQPDGDTWELSADLPLGQNSLRMVPFAAEHLDDLLALSQGGEAWRPIDAPPLTQETVGALVAEPGVGPHQLLLNFGREGLRGFVLWRLTDHGDGQLLRAVPDLHHGRPLAIAMGKAAIREMHDHGATRALVRHDALEFDLIDLATRIGLRQSRTDRAWVARPLAL